MMKQVCIICSKEATGIAVADTQVIRAIRAIKRKFNMAANNRLLVCHGCMEEYKKRRNSFERKVMLYGAIGIGLIILSVAMPLMGGGQFSITSIFLVILLAIFLLALAFLSYIPALVPSAQVGEENSQDSHPAQKKEGHGLAEEKSAAHPRPAPKKHAIRKAKGKKTGRKKR